MDDSETGRPDWREAAQLLTVQQLSVLNARMSGASWSECARATNTGRRTILRWRQEIPEFQLVEQALIAEVIGELAGRLPLLVEKACRALDQNLSIPHGSDLKTKAAGIVLDFVAKALTSANDCAAHKG